MKKLMVAGVVAGLLVGSMLAPAQAAKKKKPKPKPPAAPVAVDLQYFLVDSDGCTTSENFLSLTDDATAGCWYVDSGAAYDARVEAGANSPADLSQSWTATTGVPFTLDATRHIVGEISTEGGACILADPSFPCSPATLSGGNVTLDVVVQAEIDGEMQDIGTFTETFQSTPGTTHTSKIDIALDAALDKKQVPSLNVLTYIHGPSVMHGTIVLDDPSSFITVPALQ